jgi:Ca2+-binding RTX toxin-like protein
MTPVRRKNLARLAVLTLASLLVAGSVPALGKRIVATKRADRVVGTKRADVIRAGAGNDRVRGKAGNDRISGGNGNDRLSGDSGRDRVSGGRGRDRLTGGRGKDRLGGGPGNDVLNAVDRARDGRVDGGAGRNTCRIDSTDLRVVAHCNRLIVSGGGAGAGGGSGSGAGASSLGLSTADGLSCGSQLPLCTFQLSGKGANAPAGTVTGGGGVTGAGGGVSTSGDSWSATGSYGCTENGYLLVTIGEKSIKVPVSCST